MLLTATGGQGEVVEGSVARGLDRERFVGAWTADDCAASAEIRFSGHTEPFQAEVRGFGYVGFGDWDDLVDLDGQIALSGP